MLRPALLRQRLVSEDIFSRKSAFGRHSVSGKIDLVECLRSLERRPPKLFTQQRNYQCQRKQRSPSTGSLPTPMRPNAVPVRLAVPGVAVPVVLHVSAGHVEHILLVWNIGAFFLGLFTSHLILGYLCAGNYNECGAPQRGEKSPYVRIQSLGKKVP